MPQGQDHVNTMGGWFYHVAATAPVIWENGEAIEMVFDPTLFDAPVSKNQWRKHFGSDHNALAKVALDDSIYFSN